MIYNGGYSSLLQNKSNEKSEKSEKEEEEKKEIDGKSMVTRPPVSLSLPVPVPVPVMYTILVEREDTSTVEDSSYKGGKQHNVRMLSWYMLATGHGTSFDQCLPWLCRNPVNPIYININTINVNNCVNVNNYVNNSDPSPLI